MRITHTFTNPQADGGDATVVRPSNWNADHTFLDSWIVESSALTNATPAGDSTPRADHFPGTSPGGTWAAEATALSNGPTVKYSALYLRQSVSTVASHYLKPFTPSGAFRIEVQIRIGQSNAGGGFMVRDSGTGDGSGEYMLCHVNGTNGTFEAYSIDSGSFTARGSSVGYELSPSQLIGGFFFAIERDGSNQWTLQVSPDRVGWTTLVAAHSKTFTVAKIGYRLYGSVYITSDFLDIVS